MSVVLGTNRYGKAETRVVRVVKNGGTHEIRDLNVSVALSGDMAETHLTGGNSKVLPTDTQKNTVYAFAKEHGVGEIEEFALLLARHFVDSQPSIHLARVAVEEYFWDRVEPAGGPGERRHSFVRSGRETRTAVAHYDGERATLVSGLKDLVVLNTTGSEFWGYLKDRYTTLAETRDRVLATQVTATWRHVGHTVGRSDYAKSYARARRHLLEAFAETHSLSLQQTLYAMGARVIENGPEICEVRLALPNKHHFLVDLAPFGLENDGEVFYAADRPYGLIEGTVLREGTPDDTLAWR
ncbi:factor-independent urate hydroxylase [Bailinhaonella thermotolerans]|uniref:Uricase n=1 Tax=Bailinhaonella thermotolerans TaxID=1070861 RepID=A0A3A4AAY4_9ACTN|nr:urate oxidase [Bailinhaonella thermotolerans]RJL23584.1 urate oxidase [Bailinhaonella thermotolerans]